MASIPKCAAALISLAPLLQAVDAGAEFGEEVEDVFRLRPTQRPEAAEFGAGIVGNQHRSSSSGNGGCASNWPRHSRQVWPLRSSFATMQTGRGRSPDRLAASGES